MKNKIYKLSEKEREYERKRKRVQRAKAFEDPKKYAEFLARARFSYHKARAEGKIKLIAELSEIEQLERRKKWQLYSRNYLARKRHEKKIEKKTITRSTKTNNKKIFELHEHPQNKNLQWIHDENFCKPSNNLQFFIKNHSWHRKNRCYHSLMF